MADLHCISASCAKLFYGPVRYCPYCGQPQEATLPEPRTAVPQTLGRHDSVQEVEGPGGGTRDSAAPAVEVAQAPTPAGVLELEPAAIELGESTRLSWRSDNADAARINGSQVALAGSKSVTPAAAGRVTYKLELTGAGGSTVETATLTVRAAPAPISPPPLPTPPKPPEPRRRHWKRWLALAGLAVAAAAYYFPRPTPAPVAPTASRTEPEAPRPRYDAKGAAALVARMLTAARSGNEVGINAARDALENLAKPERGDRRMARELNRRGLDVMRDGEFDQGAQLFEQARAADPGDAEVADNVGYAYLKAGRLGQAEPALIAALSVAPTRSQAWFSMAQVYSRLGRTDEAVAAFLLAQRYAVDPPKTLQAIQEMAAADPEPAVRRVAARALELLVFGRTTARTETPQPARVAPPAPATPPTPPRAPPVAPTSTAALLGLGSSCLARNQYDCAIDAAQRALSESPSDAEARRLLGTATAAKQEARRRAAQGLQ